MTRLAFLLLILAIPAEGRDRNVPLSIESNQVEVIDGDSLRVAGHSIRLHGIDAPELAQTCPDAWAAGAVAAAQLRALTADKPVICHHRDRDRYGRIVAVCWAAGVDLGEWMVLHGYAWAFTRYSQDYVAEQQQANARRLGIHAHACQPAWQWRAEKR
jgi:endonuclease YncB( thermonuclease family)